MPIIFLHEITRGVVQGRDDYLFMYGKSENGNENEYPASEMKGERNAIGVWMDGDEDEMKSSLAPAEIHLKHGWGIVVPQEGLINPKEVQEMIRQYPEAFRNFKREYIKLCRIAGERNNTILGDTSSQIHHLDRVWKIKPWWYGKRKTPPSGCNCGKCRYSDGSY